MAVTKTAGWKNEKSWNAVRFKGFYLLTRLTSFDRRIINLGYILGSPYYTCSSELQYKATKNVNNNKKSKESLL